MHEMRCVCGEMVRYLLSVAGGYSMHVGHEAIYLGAQVMTKKKAV